MQPPSNYKEILEAERKAKQPPRAAEELLISGEFLAHREESVETPEIDLVEAVYLLIFHRDKPLVIREGDVSAPWDIVMFRRADAPEQWPAPGTAGQADTPVKRLDTWLKAIVWERWGIQIKEWYQHGRVRMIATEQAKSAPPGSERYQLFLCATAGSVEPVPETAGWARRAITGRELNVILGGRYQWYEEMLVAAHSSYLVRQSAAAKKA